MPAAAEDVLRLETETPAEPLQILAPCRWLQNEWSERTIGERLRVTRRFRRLLAQRGRELAGLVAREPQETLSSELIPLADAARFLELQAGSLLRRRKLSRAGRPGWLRGVEIAVEREPYGVVLLIAPSNYPLLLAGVQALQGLVAGNAVLWKPGIGGRPIANGMRQLLEEAGLPRGLLAVLDESEASARHAIAAGVDKIVLTGSYETGRSVLAQAAETMTPATVELSGCDAFFVMPGADLDRACRALLFGLTFNGGATCIAPRRIFVHTDVEREFAERVRDGLRRFSPIAIKPRVAAQVAELLEDAESKGGQTLLSSDRIAPASMRPLVIAGAKPEMLMMQSDVFAPVAAMMTVGSLQEAVAASNACRYALGASIFAAEPVAQNVAKHLRAGVVVINDAVAPTADARLSFGGRGSSGFGKTRGAEGLLEMTVSKSIVTQRGRRLRHLEHRDEPAIELILESYLRLAHGPVVGRLRAAAELCRAALGKTTKRQ